MVKMPWRRKRPTTNLAAETLRPTRLDALGGSLTGTYRQEWQDEAWETYRDNVGEFSAVVEWRANAISRANLYIGRTSHDGSTPKPVDDPQLNSLMDTLGTGGSEGHSQMLHRMSVHMDVPGETVLVGTETTDGQHWFAASTNQIETVGGQLAVKVSDSAGVDGDYLMCGAPGDRNVSTVVSRIWRPDPKEPWLAFSPARYARKPLRILNRLTDRVNANTLSRLQNQLMIINSELMLPKGAGDMGNIHDDPQLSGLIYAASQAIRDPESPAAVIPMVARVGGDPTNMIKMVDFGTPFDEQLVPLFDLFIRRLALMLNVPPEILLGLATSNHWSGWLVSDEAVRIHLASTLELLCDGLTRVYLRPAIAGLNDSRIGLRQPRYNPRDYTIWYDPSRITERPNRAEDARADYASGLINETAVRRASGYGEDDQPSETERRNRILLELAMAGRTVEDAGPWLQAMGISLDPPPVATRNPAGPDVGTPGPPLPSLTPVPVTSGPGTRNPVSPGVPSTGTGVR